MFNSSYANIIVLSSRHRKSTIVIFHQKYLFHRLYEHFVINLLTIFFVTTIKHASIGQHSVECIAWIANVSNIFTTVLWLIKFAKNGSVEFTAIDSTKQRQCNWNWIQACITNLWIANILWWKFMRAYSDLTGKKYWIKSLQKIGSKACKKIYRL